MATYSQWSQSYFVNDTSRDDIVVADLTSDQHDVNNQWFQCMRDKLTDNELKEEISLTMDEEIYDELVDNVTNETVLDTNNNGGKF